ncbi:hypothetical protein C483_10136 [Natrialba hulunbeirensis JCM 10989]|uniref:DUF4382 domain-containing protein n=1 Tax=Natrialba hulunbeirensis JCM 10989 TaxID=1227493 RepID=L9ZX23_9EURY|nr:DUF4382 domain-containing protein [Natrialba hulunbeirensis]ELY91035.1 hypothetical protein C483_10136 [Natrialba hulunbeirensis JCM 10989]
MTSRQPTRDDSSTTDRQTDAVGRRTVIAAAGGAGTTLLAGCMSDGEAEREEGEEATGTTDSSTSETGSFRLLISDMPADIGDFERLDVSFNKARIFDGGAEEESDADGEEDTEDGASEEETDTDGTEPDGDRDGENDGETAAGDGNDDETEGGDDGSTGGESDAGTDTDTDTDTDIDGSERREGFYILDLDGATVDLTEVVGDKAIGVFDGELSAGSYEKIELFVEETNGIVDGEEVDVTVPSEKLQITSSFEIRADEPVEFVFDINVVKRGPDNGYNLTPVISKSGVNGNDVSVEEIEPGDAAEDADDEPDEQTDDEEDGSDGTATDDDNETDDDDADNESDTHDSDDERPDSEDDEN